MSPKIKIAIVCISFVVSIFLVAKSYFKYRKAKKRWDHRFKNFYNND